MKVAGVEEGLNTDERDHLRGDDGAGGRVSSGVKFVYQEGEGRVGR